jgi:hypothetical protein
MPMSLHPESSPMGGHFDARASSAADADTSAVRRRAERQGTALLALFAVLGIALVLLYPDSSSADGGTHFLEARWAWVGGHRSLLVDVWGRPLFTAVYSLPAYFGYRAAKLFTIALCVACAWQTWRTAELLRFGRAALVIPLLFLQPSFLMVAPETMTEPLFALVFIVALRLHLEGRVRAGAVIASLLPLARPEGPFLVALWGLWILFDGRDARPWWRKIPTTFLLATGMVLWWLGALAITHDPLWIRHNAPWQWTSATASHGSILHYWDLRKQIFGSLLWVPLVVGMITLLVRRRTLEVVSAAFVIFALHSTMWAFGLLNTEGYPRYISCTAPALALVTLAGWNLLADALSRAFDRLGWSRARSPITALLSVLVLLYSAWYAAMYVDGQEGSRASWAMNDTYRWFREHPRPVRQLGWSRAYMSILFDWDLWKNLPFTNDREQNISVLKSAPSGTLVFWDAAPGVEWYHLTPDDFQRAGYVQLRSKSYELYPLLPGTSVDHGDWPRKESMYLFYKE